MSKKINFPVRLDPDVIDKINSMAAARKITIQDLLCNALEAQDREDRTTATVEERLQNMENNVGQLVDILRDFLPRLNELDESIWRIQKASRTTILFLEMASAGQRWPDRDEWSVLKKSELLRYDENRKERAEK